MFWSDRWRYHSQWPVSQLWFSAVDSTTVASQKCDYEINSVPSLVHFQHKKDQVTPNSFLLSLVTCYLIDKSYFWNVSFSTNYQKLKNKNPNLCLEIHSLSCYYINFVILKQTPRLRIVARNRGGKKPKKKWLQHTRQF